MLNSLAVIQSLVNSNQINYFVISSLLVSFEICWYRHLPISPISVPRYPIAFVNPFLLSLSLYLYLFLCERRFLSGVKIGIAGNRGSRWAGWLIVVVVVVGHNAVNEVAGCLLPRAAGRRPPPTSSSTAINRLLSNL